MNKLFVGNLSFTATDEDLKNFFEQYGHAVDEIKIMTDRDTGKPRGFGFVTLGESANMKRAIQDLQGQEFMGRALTVNEAKPKEPRSGGPGGPGGGGGNARAGNRREPRW
jgi:RNA recognition motif-containing protein